MSGIAAVLAGHEVTEARERGWGQIPNGELVAAAEAEGFNVLGKLDGRLDVPYSD